MQNKNTRPLRRYRNRFTSIDEQPCGGWIVWSDVAGLPLDAQGQLCDGSVEPKIHATYVSARETQLVLENRYKSLR